MSFEFDQLPHDDSDVIQQHSRSFSLAAGLLPRAVRSDVEKLYAWCRWCDDAVDESPTPAAAKQRIELLRADVRLIYDGQAPQHPASQWLGDLVDRYNLPREWPLDLLSGMERDTDSPVMETREDLLLYCYQAAGTVGLMMCQIMGVTDPVALSKAKALGMAMQLTNIARDVEEDWRVGRRYLPRSSLSLVPGKDMLPTNEQVRPAVAEILELADELYSEGNEGLAMLPHGVRFAIRLAGKVYGEIGHEIRRRDFAVMSGRAFVSGRRKIWLVGQCLASETLFRVGLLLRQAVKPLGLGETPRLDNANGFRNATHFSAQSRPLPARPIHSKLTFNPFSQGYEPMKNETLYLFYLGISLTLVMATTLFLLVGLNPKATTYESLPWIYSGTCALLAAVTGLIARRYNTLHDLEAAKVKAE